MHIGYSEIDITPRIGVELCGYGMYPGRRAEAVKDHLYARAVAFIEGQKRLLLVNCDLLTLSGKIVKEVKQGFIMDLGLKAEDILLISTHTYTAPSASDTEGIGERDEEYVQTLPALLVTAGKEAFKNTKQVKEARQVKTEVSAGIGYNRVNPEGPVDKSLRGMAFYFDKGKPLALLSYGCHPVTLGPSGEISADYPGAVVRAMDRAGYDCLFLTGFCGDIDPVSNRIKWGSGTQETLDEYGNTITDAFIEKIAEAGTMENMSPDSFEIPVRLRMAELTGEALDCMLEENAGEKVTYPGKYRLLQAWVARMRQDIAEKENPYEKTIVTQVFKIGGVVLFGFSAEMFTALAFPLIEALPEMNVMALGNANVTTGYIATRDDIENKGYAGFESSFVYLTLPLWAGEGERLAEEVAKEAKAIFAKA